MTHRMGFLVALLLLPSGPAGADFLRGDANLDGRVDISDPIAQVSALFLGGGSLRCDDAADTNDDGQLGVEDAIAALAFLFGGGPLPAPGSIGLGPDPTCDRLGCATSPDPTPAIVIHEIQYSPTSSPLNEYVELHNRSHAAVDASGLRFTRGIDFVIPDGTVIPPGGFLLILKDPAGSRWRRLEVLKVGPYEGVLSDGGERLTLVDGDCLVESVRYGDRLPWAVAPDGEGNSLERVDVLAPADDFHAWRASSVRLGTPGAANSSAGIPARPTIEAFVFEPAAPNSTDPIEVRITLDAPLTSIASVTLHWEAAGEPLEPVAVPMEASARGPTATEVRAVMPPQPSWTLVRCQLEVALAGGGTLFLPHPVEPRAFLSCFVHDFDVASRLPILWLFPKRRTGLPGLDSRTISAGVILEPGSRTPLVFDGADLRSSTQGLKLRFVKGEEYRDDRTINIIPEQGGGGTGSMAPHMEHLGFTVFRDLGAVTPRVDWFRVVEMGTATRLQTQRLIIQQVNERFLEMNGIDENGDLYKLDKSVFQKKTNLHTGIGNLNDILAALSRGTPESRRAAVLDRLDIESVGLYSTVNILIENWDGFHNNFYVYHDLTPEGRWMIIPWDLDQVFEPVRFDFPVNFPLTGQSTTVSRETGPLARPYHLQPDLHEAYREAMRVRIAPGGPFTTEGVNARIDAIEVLLLEDLALLEEGTRSVRAARRLQIKNAHAAMKTFMEKRIPFLRAALGN